MLSGLAQVTGNSSDSEKQESAFRVSDSPVKIVLADLKVMGERRTGGDFLRDEKFGEFECRVLNWDYRDQKARRNGVVRWNQAREELLRIGDTNKASFYVEKPLPTFPPCALRIDCAVTNWILNPSVKIFRVAGIKDGKRFRGEGWTVEELGGEPTLWMDSTDVFPVLLENTPLILYGKLDKTVTDKLENGEYELEVSLDTAKATGRNVANTGVIACRFFFRIKSPENDGEKWWLERKKFQDAEGKGEWTAILSLSDDALKRYQSQVVIYWLWYWKGKAFQNSGKDEEALAAYEESWKHRWRTMEPHDEWPVTEPLRELRQKLNKLPPKKP